MRSLRSRVHAAPDARRGHAATAPAAEVPAADPAPSSEQPGPEEPDPGHAAERRLRDAGGPEDQATYSCRCGAVFPATPTTSVSCPLCGVHQAW